ncbi:rod shape-determining protein MreC [Clostridium thailandense]|uniref:Cell shape-determining protein MreC n=1 Tax=Clostridium thailandense TaxID=2794346 RepID=A0A949TIU3_9CLOT|nr:rod shape-determining protein MreC [Clostridium thailandense]MBV7273075.1 rod shape-determining protein MreC [Clostridium thailandense]MCH5135739.1 rod shape-determining protein MreC [Clostridiaceae bacterium UIB06]
MKFLKNKLAVTIVVLSVTFLILISHSIKGNNMSFMRNGVGVTFNSVQGVIFKFNSGVKNFAGSIFNFSNIKKENEDLKKKNSELENKIIDYQSLKSENERLRKTLNFKEQRAEFNYIGGDIVEKGANGMLDQFVINRGSKDGIGKGMVAVTYEGLVGQVTSVGSNWAIVQTLANENIAVSGAVESTNDNNGIVKGYKDSNNNLLAKLYYLPLDSNIKKGDVILTSGLGGLYPKGIRIGDVIDIEEDKGKVMKNAIIKPYVDFNKLDEILIIVPKDKMDYSAQVN